MGSDVLLPEWVDETLLTIGIGAGILIWFITTGKYRIFKGLAGGTFVTTAMAYYRRRTDRLQPSDQKVVFITGCDSGLGFSLALHTHQMGYHVIAACLNTGSEGAAKLLQKCNPYRFRLVQLDVTVNQSVEDAFSNVQNLLNGNPKLELYAVVNNAGVMVFGEFEWMTERLIKQQIDVNLLGTMRVTKMFCPLLRKYQGRVIIISSHCATATLPGLAVYGATKAALRAWSDGLRVEQAKYDVPVITYAPGNLIHNSNIMAHHNANAQEMENGLTAEGREFYGDYFQRYNSYLSGLSVPHEPEKLHDKSLHLKFERTLLDRYPCPHYEHGPWRYTIYHTLFKLSPYWLRDILVTKFVQMPAW